jgi:hypothetical protein
MNTFVSAICGIAFGVLGTATVFLMFHLWGYPFDKATRTSAAPRSLMLLHRVLGYLFVALYIFMMVQMVPRLLRYQVEFPPRTVAHIMLGITIGFLLLIKLSIIRFFRHLEEWMPYLGTGILLCTYLLLGLSVPFSFRERALRRTAVGGDVLSAANLDRLKRILPGAGFPAEAPLADLLAPANILTGRDVLLRDCVQCHDLRTVLARPRVPKDWVQTVERMSEKPVFGDSITTPQQWAVATYLIAITPELQESAKKARAQSAGASGAKVSAAMTMESPDDDSASFSAAAVKPLFDTKCSQCHELDDVNNYKWTTLADEKELLRRMVDNGLECEPKDLGLLDRYLVVVYVAPAGGGAPAAPPPAAPADSTTPPPAAPSANAAAPSPGGRAGGKRTPSSAAAPSAASAAPAPAAPPPGAALACGTKPLPDCPLQAFMKQRVVPASASEDLGAIASVLDRIAKMAPPGYGSWSQISSDGANAARAGNVKDARASCATCHTQYRSKYKAEIRARAIQ